MNKTCVISWGNEEFWKRFHLPTDAFQVDIRKFARHLGLSTLALRPVGYAPTGSMGREGIWLTRELLSSGAAKPGILTVERRTRKGTVAVFFVIQSGIPISMANGLSEILGDGSPIDWTPPQVALTEKKRRAPSRLDGEESKEMPSGVRESLGSELSQKLRRVTTERLGWEWKPHRNAVSKTSCALAFLYQLCGVGVKFDLDTCIALIEDKIPELRPIRNVIQAMTGTWDSSLVQSQPGYMGKQRPSPRQLTKRAVAYLEERMVKLPDRNHAIASLSVR